MLFNALYCACSGAAEITDIPASTCAQDFGQVQKIIFQRTKDGTTVNTITIGTSNPNLLATWTALKAASDSTKVQVTPFIGDPSNEAGDAREFGGGNQTLNGVPIIKGSNPSPFECKLYNLTQDIIEALKTYMCESAGVGLSVFLINEHGQIAGQADDLASPTTFKGFPIQSLFVSDLKLGMYEEVDSNMMKWQFKANWSDKFHIVTPSDFDALSEL